jgi:ankyrin repeat protein
MSASQKKKSLKGTKDVFEKYPPPDMETLAHALDDTYLFRCALANQFQDVCGAFDAKEHELANFVMDHNLFNKRNEHGKTVLDLAAFVGSKDFIKAILERSNDKLDESVLDLRAQLKRTNAYNLMHYAVIWNRIELVKFLVDQSKLIVDPSLDSAEMATQSTVSMRSSSVNANFKTLGSVLLKTKTKAGETPKDLAKRYGHAELVDFLNYAGVFMGLLYSFEQNFLVY